MAESYQKKLNRVRKPRVHITYDVETGDAMEKKELPFVVGVMGDFSGNPADKLEPLKDRKFVQIDRDNFDDVMKRFRPELNMRVDNTLANDGSQMAVSLDFESMDDFSPANVAKQIEPLRKLLATRDNLRDLLTKIDRSDDLETLLEDVMNDADQLKKLAGELGVEEPAKGDA